MPLLHGFLLTFGFSWQEFPFLGLWCKRGGCCLFAGIFISFPDILSARKCWLVRLSVMPDFSFFGRIQAVCLENDTKNKINVT